MLVHHIILILLYWPCVGGTETKAPEFIIDQLATGSENFTPLSTAFKNSTVVTNSVNASFNASDSSSIIHYENSNGFIPMNNYDSSQSIGSQSYSQPLKYDRPQNLTSENSINDWENDPAFSTEARFLLTIPHAGPVRRSFDLNESQKEFEILKVNNKTPAIANYHEFYENLQNNLRTGSSNSWPNDSDGNVSPTRTKERIRQIDEYFDYNAERYHKSRNYQFQNYPKINSQRDTLQQSSVFEPAKVHNNYQQYGAMNYQVFDDSVINEKTSNLQRNNFPSPDHTKKNNEKITANKHRHQNSKPVIIPEPNNYKANSNYDMHQPITKASTTDPYISQKYEITTSEDRYDWKEDYSDESSDYLEITERPKRLQKNRRRPYNSENSKKAAREQKNDRQPDELKKINSSGRNKSHRSRAKPSYWNDERQQSFEDNSEEKYLETPNNSEENENHSNNLNKQNVWSQVAPNVEYSPSNSYEINPMDNSKLLVPVNLVPITHFDHATALGNSQGFDVSNAGLPNIVTAAPIMTSTASPLINQNPTIISPHLMHQSQGKNYGYSNSVSDIIVGQNSYQNPVQAVLLPQMNVHTKYASNVKPQYIASTMAPMFSFTQSLTPTIQSVQSTQSPRITTPGNQYGPQVFFPQSTLQTLLQTPVNSAGNYNIFVNTRGTQTQTTKPTSPSITNSNHGTVNTERKNTYHGTGGQILTSASFSVSQDGNNHGSNNNNNDNSNSNQNNINNRDNKYQLSSTNGVNNYFSSDQNNPHLLKSQMQTNLYPLIRETQVVPAYIQAPNGISTVNLINQNQGHQAQSSVSHPTYLTQIPKNPNQQHVVNVANNIFENTWRQLQQLENNEAYKNGRYQNVYGQNVYGLDSLGSTSNNNVNTANNIKNFDGFIKQAQLPVVGMQTVEIRNPNINIKPSPIDLTMVNPLETINHYPTAVLTTPIPILSTTGFFTPRPLVTSTTPESISIQSYVDSLTQIGSQNNQGMLSEPKTSEGNPQSGHLTFNPMNFVPNLDLIRSQSLLNSKIHVPKPLPKHLNLIPIIPGGNFDKHSPTAQIELINKPKLSSDLEKYAEEMFKESLRTIYNSHKWNTDKKIRNFTESDIAELEKLKTDLGRFKVAMMNSNHGKEILEAHHSETKIRTAEPGRENKNTGLSVSALEQLFKSDFKTNKPSENSHASHINDSKRPDSLQKMRINDYLTPPKPDSHVSKSPFLDKPGKKRPPNKGHRHENIKSRPHSRPITRPGSLDTSASNHVIYSRRRPYHDRSNSHNDHKKNFKSDNYPTFTTSSPNTEIFQIPTEDETYKRDYYDVNHARTHNLLGLLMKNKQLPKGGSSNFFSDENELQQYLEEERRRAEKQFYDELQSFQKKSDTLQPPLLPKTNHFN